MLLRLLLHMRWCEILLMRAGDGERQAQVKLAWIRLATLDLTYFTSHPYTHLLQKEGVHVYPKRPGAGCVGEAGTYRQ